MSCVDFCAGVQYAQAEYTQPLLSVHVSIRLRLTHSIQRAKSTSEKFEHQTPDPPNAINPTPRNPKPSDPLPCSRRAECPAEMDSRAPLSAVWGFTVKV